MAQLRVIADDRLGTGQQHQHLTLHWPLAAGLSDPLRLTADLLHKHGLGDTGPVSAWGWTLGPDGKVWFARLTHDPKQNFSAQDAWHLSAGRRVGGSDRANSAAVARLVWKPPFDVTREATKAVGQPTPSMPGPEARAQSPMPAGGPTSFTYRIRSPNALGRRHPCRVRWF